MNFDNKTLTHDRGQPLRTVPAKRDATRIFYGGWVVLASAFGFFWGIPISVYSFSVFFRPLMLEFHVGRAAVSLAFTLKLLAGASSQPRIPTWTRVTRYRKSALTSEICNGGMPKRTAKSTTESPRREVFYSSTWISG